MESTNQEETINELKAADSGEEWEPLIARLEADDLPAAAGDIQVIWP